MLVFDPSLAILRQRLHTDHQPAAGAVSSLEGADKLVNASKVEVPHAEVRAMRNSQRVLKRWEKRILNIVEYPRRLPLYTPSNGRSFAVTSASTSAEALATNSARRAVQSALLRWSAKTTPDRGKPAGSATSKG